MNAIQTARVSAGTTQNATFRLQRIEEQRVNQLYDEGIDTFLFADNEDNATAATKYLHGYLTRMGTTPRTEMLMWAHEAKIYEIELV